MAKIKLKIKKGDNVRIIAGDDKGKTGEVLQVIPATRSNGINCSYFTENVCYMSCCIVPVTGNKFFFLFHISNFFGSVNLPIFFGNTIVL